MAVAGGDGCGRCGRAQRRTPRARACGLLSVLPLHAATDEHGRAVIDHRSVRHIPNARALAMAQDRAARPELGSGLLAIQDPRPSRLPVLPYAAAEVDAACARLAVGPVTRLPAPGTPANADRVLKAASRQRILHFCCHGSADPLDPVRSMLHLADDEQITAANVMARRIVSRLVVLSACESGIIGRDLARRGYRSANRVPGSRRGRSEVRYLW